MVSISKSRNTHLFKLLIYVTSKKTMWDDSKLPISKFLAIFWYEIPVTAKLTPQELERTKVRFARSQRQKSWALKHSVSKLTNPKSLSVQRFIVLFSIAATKFSVKSQTILTQGNQDILWSNKSTRPKSFVISEINKPIGGDYSLESHAHPSVLDSRVSSTSRRDRQYSRIPQFF